MEKLFEIMPLFYYDLASVVVFFMVFFTLKSRSKGVKYGAIYVMCVLNLTFYLINDYYFYIGGSDVLTLLPLQLCNIAVFLIPTAVASKKQLLLDFAFYICAPGAFAALLFPSSDYIDKAYSLMTISFFIFHYMIAVIPFLLAGWGIYSPAPTVRKALRLSITILVLGGSMHIFNLAMGRFLKVEADYFFTVIKYSAPANPALDFLSRVIPYDFIYLLPALVVLYFYMGVVYFITRKKSRELTLPL